MNYCKINTQSQPELMPNPFRVVVSNPSEEQKAALAELFGWLEMVYTDAPGYDPDTQYATSYWVEEDGKAVQKWEIHDNPTPERTLDERVDNLEEAVGGIISGETGT